MFDSVFASCPHCGEQLEFQSKAGECYLMSYSAGSVPIEIAESVDGDVEYCSNCHTTVKITIAPPDPAECVRMVLK